MKIIFLHGKESTPETSSSAKAIIEYFTEDEVFVLNYEPMNGTFDEVDSRLDTLIKEIIDDEEFVIIGISLGGYWALKKAHDFPNCKCILLNPALEYYTPIEVNPFLFSIMYLNLDDEVIKPIDILLKYCSMIYIHTFPNGGHRMNNIKEILPLIEKSINIQVL